MYWPDCYKSIIVKYNYIGQHYRVSKLVNITNKKHFLNWEILLFKHFNMEVVGWRLICFFAFFYLKTQPGWMIYTSVSELFGLRYPTKENYNLQNPVANPNNFALRFDDILKMYFVMMYWKTLVSSTPENCKSNGTLECHGTSVRARWSTHYLSNHPLQILMLLQLSSCKNWGHSGPLRKWFLSKSVCIKIYQQNVLGLPLLLWHRT